MSSYATFLGFWHEYMLSQPQLRLGQALFNAAWLFSSQTEVFTVRVIDTPIDPFTDDTKIAYFLSALQCELDGQDVDRN